MKQYCRYCIHLVVNNAPWCEAHKAFRSESSCKTVNNCADFEFADCPPEYQDAFGETGGYRPRVRKKDQVKGQTSLIFIGGTKWVG